MYIENIKYIINRLPNILFPQTCPVCDKVTGSCELICNGCNKKIKYVKEPKCKKCGKPVRSDESEYCEDCNKNTHLYDCGIAVFEYSE
ncbi:MAG: double zinc ribbon domain-containing protein, partial [Lachnospiraceae bacterium]|nr:double zinc ribbon domain-containing protein [Lachnospiraceae bacterium]